MIDRGEPVVVRTARGFTSYNSMASEDSDRSITRLNSVLPADHELTGDAHRKESKPDKEEPLIPGKNGRQGNDGGYDEYNLPIPELDLS